VNARRTPTASGVIAVERQHVRARLRRIAVDHRALGAAIDEQFGSDFDRDRWIEDFESDDPGAVNRVATVVSAFERIVNGLVEAARSGLVAGGVARAGGTPETVRTDLERVRDDGGMSDRQLGLLVDLSRTRNQLQHVYVDVSADDVRTAVRRLRGNLPALTRALNAWLTRYGVGV
jgi:uncharacterized protein YutE (UPF0331/DUF86 family)